MSKPESAAALPLGAIAHATRGWSLDSWKSRTAAVVLGSAFVALCAHIAVPLPWTPVPMTMQPFAVLLVGLLLGPALGAAAMVAYLAEAAVGLPVLVPGFGALLPVGPSEGYLLSYPAVALVAGFLFGRTGGFVRAAAAATAGELVILLCGASWLALFAHAGMAGAVRLGVLPFLAGDAVKVALAAGIAGGFRRQFRPVGSERGVSSK